MKIIYNPIELHTKGYFRFYTEVNGEGGVGELFFYKDKQYKITRWEPLIYLDDDNGNHLAREFEAQLVWH